MEPQINFNLDKIKNIDSVINSQTRKFHDLLKLVHDLKFIPVDPVGAYSAVSYKSIDGGKMGITFNPFELDYVVIADSLGYEIMNFLVPKGDTLQPADFEYF